MTQEEKCDETPEAICPRCGQPQPDLDGFGVVKCDHCDYCSHASATLDDANRLICNLCNKVLP